MRRLAPWAAAAALVAAAACAEQLTFAEVKVTSIQNAGAAVTAAAGSAVSVSVKVLDQKGRGVPGQAVGFTAGAGTVSPASATTDAQGVATTRWTVGTTAGSQTLTAAATSASGVSVQLPATVGPGAASTGTISSAALSFDALTDTARLTVTNIRDAFGNAISGATVTWSVLDTTIATVPSAGLVRSLANGTTTVRASVGGAVVASASVTVAQVATSIALTPARSRIAVVNDSLLLTVAALDRLGQVVTGAGGITYTSSAPGVATVASTRPMVKAAGTGRATITATRGTVTASVLVAAGPAVATRVVASPDSTRVFSSARSATFTATTFDQDSIPMTGRTYAFTSLDTAIATVVSATGVATSRVQGTARIRAADGAITSPTVSFNVTQVVASIATATDTISVTQGDTVAIAATARDSAGAVVAGVAFTYSSAAASTASTTAAGGVVGVANGSTTVSVTSGGRSRSVVVNVLGTGRWRQVAVSGGIACGITTGNELYCWGGEWAGGPGFGGTNKDSSSLAPRRPAGTSTLRWSQVVAGRNTCALTTTGQAYCWGDGSQGRLAVNPVTLPSFTSGTTTIRYRSTPDSLATPLRFSKLAMHRGGTCGIASAGTTVGRVACWGENYGQQAGVPSSGGGGADTTINTVRLTSDTTAYRDLAGSDDAMCAIRVADGLTYCWGGPAFGIKGASTTYTPTPSLLHPSLQFSAISGGYGGATFSFCGLASGVVHCWGYNGVGMLGRGTINTSRNTVPTPISSPAGVTFTSVSNGGGSACATATTGDLYCWGLNQSRQLGITAAGVTCTGGGTDGSAVALSFTATCITTPTRIDSPLTFASVSMDVSFYAVKDGFASGVTCGIRPSGTLYCWGANMGNRGSRAPNAPTAVPVLSDAPAN